MINHKKYKYFLMDLDGTITNPKEGITKAIAHALRSYGIAVDDLDSLCKWIGPPLMDSFQKYVGFSKEQSKEAVMKYREYYNSCGIYENYLYDGMEILLQNITSKGGKVILATSKPEIYAKKILEFFHIDTYFSFVAGSNMDLSRSKKGEVIAYAIDSMKIPVKEAVMIGDREHDIIGARENGMDSIGVLYGFGDKHELDKAGADYIVDDIAALKEFVNQYMDEG